MSHPKMTRFLGALFALALVAAACGGDDDTVSAGDGAADSATDDSAADDSAADDSAADDSAADGSEAPTAGPTSPPVEVDNTDLTVKPQITVPEGDAPADLVVNDIVEGAGEPAAAGDFTIMQYVGVSYSTGEQFDASWDRGQPFTFILGQGQVIQGWDDGIVGMMAGGRRELTIPPAQAYGESGSGSGSIAANETLIFIVDLVGIVPGELEKPEVTVPDAPVEELQTTDLVEGDGPALETEQVAWVHYVGVAQSNGEQFDSSFDRGIDQPIAFAVGVGQVIPGWDEGLLGMKVGGRREIVIPASLAYGDAGAGDGLIAPGETLVFVVDLVAIS